MTRHAALTLPHLEPFVSQRYHNNTSQGGGPLQALIQVSNRKLSKGGLRRIALEGKEREGKADQRAVITMASW